MRLAAIRPFALSLVLALPLVTVTAVHAEDEPPADAPAATGDEEPREALLTLCGKLEAKTSKDAPTELRIVVGDAEFRIEGAADETVELRRKLVVAQGRLERRDDVQVLVLVSPERIVEQRHSEVQGTVVEAPEAASGLVLVNGPNTFDIPRKAKRKFVEFLGKHVAVTTRFESAPGHLALADVDEVERRLLPGEREPDSGEAALSGSWNGTLTATRVPSGIPGIEAGAELPLVFTTDLEAETTSGRLFDSYDVVGVRLRKFKTKRRTVVFDLDYSFGEGSYAVRFEGAFSEDWKTLSGEWKSGFLGEGTFDLRFVTEEETPATGE